MPMVSTTGLKLSTSSSRNSLKGMEIPGLEHPALLGSEKEIARQNSMALNSQQDLSLNCHLKRITKVPIKELQVHQEAYIAR